MKFLTFLSGMRDLPRYILTRGILLSCALLASTLAVLIRARNPAADTFFLLACSDYIQDMALTVLAAALIGSALLEDVLESKGEP